MARARLAPDRIQPTAHQISENIMVVPIAFIEQHRGKLPWSRFDVMLFGERLPNRRLGSDNRVGIPLNGRVQLGDVLSLSVADGCLVIEKLIIEKSAPA